MENKNDAVHRPAHYTDGKIEVIDFIEDKKLGFNLGNAVKYISRAGKKDPSKHLEDLQKALWYLNREIGNLKAKIKDDNIGEASHVQFKADFARKEAQRLHDLTERCIIYPLETQLHEMEHSDTALLYKTKLPETPEKHNDDIAREDFEDACKPYFKSSGEGIDPNVSVPQSEYAPYLVTPEEEKKVSAKEELLEALNDMKPKVVEKEIPSVKFCVPSLAWKFEPDSLHKNKYVSSTDVGVFTVTVYDRSCKWCFFPSNKFKNNFKSGEASTLDEAKHVAAVHHNYLTKSYLIR